MSKKSRKKDKEKKPNDSLDLLGEVLEAAGKENGAQLLGSEGLAIKIRGVISTQCPGIDAALGRGGFPLSRLSILHGKPGSGKTTLALHIVAECQRQGGIVVYIDKEYKLDPDYARKVGVDTERLIIVQPSYLEKVFEICESIIEKAAKHRKKTKERIPILIVLDSMNAAITKSQYEGGFEDQPTYGPQAKVFSQSLPKLIPLVSKEDICLLFVSQVRKKIGVIFGDDEEIAGGSAPKFYASIIAKITRMGSIKETKNFKTELEKKRANIIANKIKVEIVKNQVAPPFRKALCEIRYGEGIDKEASLVELAISENIFEKSGVWYKFKDETIGQGVSGVAKFLRDNPKIRSMVLKKVRKKGRW